MSVQLLRLLSGSILTCLILVAGCATTGGPIPDESAATAAALQYTTLEEPIEVVDVRRGIAGELVWTPGGLYADEASAQRDQARKERLAWAVVLRGMAPDQCHTNPCPLIETRQDLAIDVETGELLLMTTSGGFGDEPVDVIEK